jgi:sulfur-oxidizing protein SoxX
MGDWKKGEKLAQSGYGWRFTDYPPRAENGGNCYACHQLDNKELSFGTLGPSLAEYGKIRKFAAVEVKAVYERIYNPQAIIPCANMPRMGAAKFLTIDQIKDLTAYVMSPESPVNK